MKLNVDLPNTNFIVPPEFYSTNEQPDICIWSVKLKKILRIELTCPAEEGIEAAKKKANIFLLLKIFQIQAPGSQL